MVILKNIKKTENSISADYYPEGNEPKGFMKIRISDGEVINHEMSCMISAPHVKRELQRIAKLDKIPEEKRLLWY